jgi:gliding motility-associated-like protein
LTLCYGDSVELNVSPLDDYTYYWTPSTYLQSPQDVSTYANPEETITYYAVGIRNQCSDTLEQRIVVNKVELNFVSDFQICGDTVSLSAASDPNSDIVWSLDPSFDDVIGQNAITTSQIGDYYVRATLGDCASVGIARVDITPECCSQENLQIPNAFSANGDGINDYFLIKDSKGIVQDFELQIFNRWGQKTFYSQDKTQKWDGFFKGVLQPSSVFDYHLSVGCIEDKGAFFIKGNITLIR